ncbi:MAG: hypothetical protein JXK05_11240, partial [Campylobacterales bacterium]|nr:hypothetical protein [Campylobacterales bacterium]
AKIPQVYSIGESGGNIVVKRVETWSEMDSIGLAFFPTHDLLSISQFIVAFLKINPVEILF